MNMCSPQIHPQFVVLNQNLEYTSSSLQESLSVIGDLHDDVTSFRPRLLKVSLRLWYYCFS